LIFERQPRKKVGKKRVCASSVIFKKKGKPIKNKSTGHRVIRQGGKGIKRPYKGKTHASVETGKALRTPLFGGGED